MRVGDHGIINLRGTQRLVVHCDHDVTHAQAALDPVRRLLADAHHGVLVVQLDAKLAVRASVNLQLDEVTLAVVVPQHLGRTLVLRDDRLNLLSG